MTDKTIPRIGISIGDINGIGPEVIMKSLQDQSMLNRMTPIIFGSGRPFIFYRKILGLDPFNFQVIHEPSQAQPGTISLINCWKEEVVINPGQPNAEAGRYALISLDAGVSALIDKKIDALVTAPINKDMVSQHVPGFTGHTGYITSRCQAQESLMILVSDSMRVALVTGHIPLKDVSDHITVEILIRKIRLLQDSLKRDFLITHPRIAVLALNPHAGENGLVGNEEAEVIRPAIEKIGLENGLVLGPFPADGFFGAAQYRHFDGVLALYHDQGLIAFKSLAFDQGVNYTAGLPVIRTSPDHGTAYDLAGKGLASEQSFLQALFLAADISKNRRQYDEMHDNPLKKGELSRETH